MGPLISNLETLPRRPRYRVSHVRDIALAYKFKRTSDLDYLEGRIFGERRGGGASSSPPSKLRKCAENTPFEASEERSPGEGISLIIGDLFISARSVA